ncbi:MAG: 50S ribosomal protein L21 [Clostridiales bacterium]|jgi:large subunit ribosomal protein L21|nr:50S ribosomal protein L21 [Clostridiales bacterium]
MYAIIETGGKQYKVKAGDEIIVELLGVEAGEKFTFDRVLGIYDEDNTVFGKPLVAGASVSAEIIGDGKAKKVIIYKHKSKKGFHKKKGHRQPFTRVKIEKINGK